MWRAGFSVRSKAGVAQRPKVILEVLSAGRLSAIPDEISLLTRAKEQLRVETNVKHGTSPLLGCPSCIHELYCLAE
jgi:hypothetical protein